MDSVFHRDISHDYPEIIRGQGIYLYDHNEKEYMDGTSGVFVSILGQSMTEIVNAITSEMQKVTFAYTAQFTSQTERNLAQKLVDWAPEDFSKAWICTSGSSANETAIKLARHYHLVSGHTEKFRVIARKHSYHGSSIGALSITGAIPRRAPYEPLLLDIPHISPPNCYRCPINLSYPSCGAACAEELEEAISSLGSETVSAFIFEPIAGGPLGALVTPEEYIKNVRQICDKHEVLLIADEVVSGIGRSGRNFAIDHADISPDIITVAKGLGAGFVPIGGVIAHQRIHMAFERAGESFVHGESFTGHTAVSAAGLATLDYIEAHNLVEYAGQLGKYLGQKMANLKKLSMVGEIRGRGLIRGIELVADKKTKQPFKRKLRIAEAVASECTESGLLILSGAAGVDGENGDTLVLAPPYVTTHDQIDKMTSILKRSIQSVASRI